MKTMNTTPSPVGKKVQQIREGASRVRRRFRHPVHVRFDSDQAPLGIRLANSITGFMGSWLFLGLQTVIVGLWIILNVAAWIKHFDPYPFILLNLLFSTQAAYAAPLILMAGNVAAARDRELWENDYATNQKAFAKIEEMEQEIKQLAEGNRELLRLLSERSERL